MTKHRLSLSAVLFYVVLFAPVSKAAGAGPITAVLPVVAVAWSYGTRAGIIAGVLAFPANMALVTLAGESVSEVMLTPPGMVGAAALLFTGVITGRLRDLGGELITSKKAAAALQRRLEFEELLGELATSFVNVDAAEIDAATVQAQGNVGRFLGAERSVLLQLTDGAIPGRVIAQWNSPGTPPTCEERRSLPPASFTWAASTVKHGQRAIRISRVDELPSEASAEHEYLEELGVRSFLGIPLVASGETIGVLSFETLSKQNQWSDTDLLNFEVAAQLFAAVLERRRTDEALRHTNRVLAAVTACNEALVRATDETQLFSDICRIIVEDAGFALAWVGLAEDDENRSVRPAAKWGDDDGYVDALRMTWADTDHARSPVATAIRERRPVASARFDSNRDFEPWAKAAQSRGYRSCIALPLIAGGAPLGALGVYSFEPDTFDSDETSILSQLADDLAYGMTVLRADARRREAEEQLRQLVRSKDHFVASVAHELRTPLAAVVGFAHELRDRPDAFSVGESTELIHLIARESTEIAGIVDDLLIIARADIGKVTIEIELLDVGVEIATVLGTLPSDIREKAEAAHKSAWVMADAGRVRQILRNLITNAYRYGGDRVRIETRVDSTSVAVVIADDGPEIDKDRQATMFEPYVGSGHQSKPASIGLGLTVSRILAHLMNGEIEYRYKDGWSVFELTLPGP